MKESKIRTNNVIFVERYAVKLLIAVIVTGRELEISKASENRSGISGDLLKINCTVFLVF